MGKRKFQVEEHELIPKHVKLSDKEKKKLEEEYKISIFELPKILKNDAALKEMDLKVGDVIKIIRKSPTAGETVYYRGVING